MLRTVVLSLAVFAVPSAFGQMAISVRSGLVHHLEGQVLLEGQPIKVVFGKFPVVQEGKTIATQDGRAEILLTPGVFLRLREDTSATMRSSLLTDSRVEIPTGTALVEVAEIGKENKVVVVAGGAEVLLSKTGLYSFDATNGEIRVFEGRADVTLNGTTQPLTKGRVINLNSGLAAQKFDTKKTDSLYLWSQTRSALIASANINAAGAARSNGIRMTNSIWAWYPGMGMLTFLPRSGYFRSPFGYSYYSPGSVWQYYSSRQGNYGGNNGGGGGGYNGASSSWSGLGSGDSRGYSGSSSSGSMSSGSVASDSGRSAAPASAPAQASPGGSRGR